MSTQLNFNNKVENNGKSEQGRLSAAEFNQLVDSVNKANEALGDFKLQVIEGEEAFEALPQKAENTIYFILEDD